MYYYIPDSTKIFRKYPHSTEYCRKMSGIFSIFHCNLNITTLQFQLSEIFLKTNKYLILLEIF